MVCLANTTVPGSISFMCMYISYRWSKWCAWRILRCLEVLVSIVCISSFCGVNGVLGEHYGAWKTLLWKMFNMYLQEEVPSISNKQILKLMSFDGTGGLKWASRVHEGFPTPADSPKRHNILDSTSSETLPKFIITERTVSYSAGVGAQYTCVDRVTVLHTWYVP